MSRLDEIRARLAAVVRAGSIAGLWTRDLIDHAPDDLAFLLAEVERLTAKLAAERADAVAATRAKSARALSLLAAGGLIAGVLDELADEIERGAHRRTP